MRNEPSSRAVFAEDLILLAVHAGHRLIDPLTPLRMTRSDGSYPKKCRLPVQRRRQATSLAFLGHSHVRGPCGCTARLGRAKSDRTRDMCTAYVQMGRTEFEVRTMTREFRLLDRERREKTVRQGRVDVP